ncbi:MAG: UvrD-helicase domain-containing protein [Ignavibacteria bacterium]|jgi:ATP-dependent exoDNAse (exonuclease V) beta subunit
MSNFLIYKSSAGSGKTYTLVKEYLKIVLNNPSDFRHTLAVTFTNKAADEMKSRIVEKLLGLAEGREIQFENELKTEGVNVNIPERAKQVLNNILHRYSYFSVMTIDSFFHGVIRSFARELRLHIGYNLEMDPDKVMNKIVDELLDESGINQELTAYLEDYIYSRMDDEKGWTIDAQVKKIGNEIFRERYWERKNALQDDISDSRVKMKDFISLIFSMVRTFESEMAEHSNGARKILEENDLTIEDFPGGSRGFMNYLVNSILNKKYEPKKFVFEAIEDPGKWIKKGVKKKIPAGIISALKEYLSQAVTNYEKNFISYNTAKELTKTIYELGVFKDLLDKLKEYRDTNRLMLISDTNNILQKVISAESSPFVYEKIGNIYKHFLIDEFQDTSTFQWGNLLPLIINSLGENNLSMVVGDVKQSIYRWRNGNMKLLLEKIYDDLTAYSSVLQDKKLNENRRSRREIVQFNNIFFDKAADVLGKRADEHYGEESGELIKRSYSDVEQELKFCKDSGYVNIKFIEQDKEDEFTTKDRANEYILGVLEELKKSKVPMKDILILVRKNKEGSDLAGFLNKNGYKVVSNESLYLSNSPKVKLLINLLKFITDNKNHLARAEILYNYSSLKNVNFDPDKLFSEVSDSHSTLFYKEMPEEFLKTPDEDGNPINRLNPILNELSLYELIENLVRIFGLNDLPDAYIVRFQDAVLEYMRENPSDITGFLDWWEDNQWSYSIIVPVQEDALRIMTIHKAKGLQSHVVIIPYANWEIDINGGKEMIWAAADEKPFDRSAFLVKAVNNLKNTYFVNDYLEEASLTNIDNLNLLYVAFTRASARLYVIVPEMGDHKYRINKLITEVIETCDALKEKYDPAAGIYETGEKTLYEPGVKEEKIKSRKMQKHISSDWYKRIIIKPKHKSLKLVKEKDFSDKTSRGILIHEIMSHIKTSDDIDYALNFVQNEGMLTEELKGKLKEEIESIINLEDVHDWFTAKWEIKNEAGILMPDGEILRPDRVMMSGNRAVMVDYKTGIEKEEHREQLDKYSDALLKSGYATVEKYILYIEEKKVVKF